MKRIELGPAGKAVAENMKRLRVARGLSLRALSCAVEAQGWRLGEDALGKIEKGAQASIKGSVRRVDADDLVVLATVLGVSPTDLLAPCSDGAAHGGICDA